MNLAHFRQNIFKYFFRNYCSIAKRKEGWQSVIGLEIHAQINTESKLFSNASVAFANPVNSNVNIFDAAIPGTLPVLNKKCVEAGVLTALSLSCTINNECTFDRKHYFYADLPTGYQITQQMKPIAVNGQLEFVVYSSGIHRKAYKYKSKLKQIQLEQDSGKSLHDPHLQRSLIDLNRAGIPLMELVFEPDLRDGEEAGALIRELILILERIGTCNCKMEEGSLRVDANVSVNRIGEELGIRTEIKNLGSVRSVINAIEFEVKRQIDLLERGGIVINETRSYDTHLRETLPMRDKEVKQDYRFMPEPNLSNVKLVYDPVNVQCDSNSNLVNIARVMRDLKELPGTTREYLMKEYGLRLESTLLIVSMPGFLDYFHSVMKFVDKSRGERASGFLQNLLLEKLNDANMSFSECVVSPEYSARIINMIENDLITSAKGRNILTFLFNGDSRTPEQIAEEEKYYKIKDIGEIETLCSKIIEENPKWLRLMKREDKKKRYLESFVKKAVKESEGKIDMKTGFEVMKKLTNYVE